MDRRTRPPALDRRDGLGRQRRALAHQSRRDEDRGRVDDQINHHVGQQGEEHVAAHERGRSSPYTVQGWRPTSVVVHPASTATKPSGPIAMQSQRNQGLSNRRSRKRNHQLAATTASLKNPMPTMTRKAKKGIATGGRSSSLNSFRPLISPSRLWVRMRLPR